MLGEIYTDSTGVAREILTELQVREMAQSGLIEFMPHSHTHPDFLSLRGTALEKEIATSKLETERLTGRRACVFAYPKGKYNEETVSVLKSQGFVAAFGVQQGITRRDSDVFCLPRNPLGKVSHSLFKLKLSDRLSTYLSLKHSL